MDYVIPCAELWVGEYSLSADKAQLDLNYLYDLLCTPSLHSTGLPPERFALVVRNSVCFNVHHAGRQVGFARVVTDFTEFASMWDVFIDEPHRGRGLGKQLVEYILQHPQLRGIFRWFLMTENAHGLYQKFGFRSESWNPWVMMRVAK